MDSKSLALVKPPAPSVTINTKGLDVMEVAGMLAKSGFFKEVRDVSQAVAKILAGAELGVGPIAALQGVSIGPGGKITYGANLIAAAIKASGRYNFRVKQLDNKSCTLAFYESGQEVGVSGFTVQDAKDAGLLDGPNKHNWQHYPRNMLFARALTNGAKWYAPDVGGGIPLYTPEEMGARVNVEGEVIAEAPQIAHQVPPPADPQDSEPEPTAERPPTLGLTDPQRRKLFATLKEKVSGSEAERQQALKGFMSTLFQKTSTKDLTQDEFELLLSNIEDGSLGQWVRMQAEGLEQEEASA